jgi:fructan beta-fructosidase
VARADQAVGDGALWVAHGQARFFASKDLKHWTHTGDFAGVGFYECPDLFCLPLDGDVGRPTWVLHDAAFRYWVGDFDGTRFVPQAGPLRGDAGANFYAAQTWTNTGPRVVQIGWMRGGEYPGMRFNQQMSFPCELSLRSTPTGVRLSGCPSQRSKASVLGPMSFATGPCAAGEELRVSRPGDLLDIVAEVETPRDAACAIRLHDLEIACGGDGAIRYPGGEAVVQLSDNVVRLRILLDRTSVEVFANGGGSRCEFMHSARGAGDGGPMFRGTGTHPGPQPRGAPSALRLGRPAHQRSRSGWRGMMDVRGS